MAYNIYPSVDGEFDFPDVVKERLLAEVNTKNSQQDVRLTNVETKNTTQDGRLDGVDTKNAQQDTRLSNIESKNSQQDDLLTEIQDLQPIKAVRLENDKWVWDTQAATHYVLIDHDGKPVVRATPWPVPNPTTPEFTW